MSSSRNPTPVPVILGPTGVGKSGVSFRLAQRLGKTEIISADARAIFRGMDIGTAKPPREWNEIVPHHLIDWCDITEIYTAMNFRRDALKLIEEIRQRKALPLVVGGSTLYLHALFGEFFEGPSADEELRDRLRAHPLEELYSELLRVDPESAKRIHPNDEQRIVRALEVYQLTGETITALQRRSEPPPYDFTKIGLTCERKVIHQRIDDRVEEMLNEGLLDEVRGLVDKVPIGSQAYKSNGYKELFVHLAGECTLEEAIHQIKVNTHTHARRQFIFFRRYDDIHWVDTTEFDAERIVDEIYNLIN